MERESVVLLVDGNSDSPVLFILVPTIEVSRLSWEPQPVDRTTKVLTRGRFTSVGFSVTVPNQGFPETSLTFHSLL